MEWGNIRFCPSILLLLLLLHRRLDVVVVHLFPEYTSEGRFSDRKSISCKEYSDAAVGSRGP